MRLLLRPGWREQKLAEWPVAGAGLHLPNTGLTYPDGTVQTTAYDPSVIAQLMATVRDLTSKLDAQAVLIAQLQANQK